jgi:HNH endonuclease
MKYRAPPADIKGLRSGRLVAIEPTEVRIRKRIMWRCVCDCGGEILCHSNHIKSSDRTSCGCTGPNDHIRDFIAENANNSGCWEWPGAQDKDGYCRTKLSGRTAIAHRAVYTIAKGEIPKGLNLLHRCDNPPCCNPDHLFPGTQKQNCEDAKAKDRHSRGERNGVSKLTDDDVRFIRANAAIMSQMDLARRFNIRQSSIWSIINRRQWKHVQD